MTKKKKLPEQGTSDNYWAVTEKDLAPIANGGNNEPKATDWAQQQQDRQEQRWHQEGGRRLRESVGTPVSLQRVVTVPQRDPFYAGSAFVERQRRRRERVQTSGSSDGQTPYVARTLAQTGTRASSGRTPIANRPLAAQQSPVPTRSGQQKPKRHRIWRLLSFLTIIVIIIVLGDFLLESEDFRIVQVNVAGTHNDVLIQRIQKMGMQGQNIFLLDVTSLTTKIDAQPEVETAELSKQWPNQVVVSIKERVPVLLWQTGQGTFSVDSLGMVIALVRNNFGANHLSTVIDTSEQQQQTGTGKSETVIRPGTWINQSAVTFATAVLKELPAITGEPATSYKLYYNGTMYSSINRTSEEGTDSNGSYTIENSLESWKAYLGGEDDPNPLSNRLLELRAILSLAQQQQQKVATIDLRFGLHPVYTVQQ